MTILTASVTISFSRAFSNGAPTIILVLSTYRDITLNGGLNPLFKFVINIYIVFFFRLSNNLTFRYKFI
jgi:hypothetical protein